MDFIVLTVLFIGFVFLECFIWNLKKKVDNKKGNALDEKYLNDSIKILKRYSYIILIFNFLLIIFSIYIKNVTDICFATLTLLCFGIYNYCTFELFEKKYAPVIINKIAYSICLLLILVFKLIGFVIN